MQRRVLRAHHRTSHAWVPIDLPQNITQAKTNRPDQGDVSQEEVRPRCYLLWQLTCLLRQAAQQLGQQTLQQLSTAELWATVCVLIQGGEKFVTTLGKEQRVCLSWWKC